MTQFSSKSAENISDKSRFVCVFPYLRHVANFCTIMVSTIMTIMVIGLYPNVIAAEIAPSQSISGNHEATQNPPLSPLYPSYPTQYNAERNLPRNIPPLDAKSVEFLRSIIDHVLKERERIFGAKSPDYIDLANVADLLNLALVSSGPIEAIELLLENGANINSKDGQESPILINAIANPLSSPEIIKLLIDNGAIVNPNPYQGHWTPLFWAVYWGNSDAVKILITAKAKINIQDQYGQTPLMQLMKRHRNAQNNAQTSNDNVIKIAEILLASGAKVNLFDKKGRTILDHTRSVTQEDRIPKLEKLIIAAGGKNGRQLRANKTQNNDD